MFCEITGVQKFIDTLFRGCLFWQKPKCLIQLLYSVVGPNIYGKNSQEPTIVKYLFMDTLFVAIRALLNLCCLFPICDVK